MVKQVVLLQAPAYPAGMTTPGVHLALLLLGGFRQFAETAEAELARRGFPGISAANEFALQAIAGGVDNASDLARRLSVSKQAAAKTIAILEQRGYLDRSEDPRDSRRKQLTVTGLGQQAMREGAAIIETLRDDWAQRIGLAELERIEAGLALLVEPTRLDGTSSPEDEVISNRQ
jgi:DNA-binding MarR family transcriptional regulator